MQCLPDAEEKSAVPGAGAWGFIDLFGNSAMQEAFEIGRGICEASEGIKKKGKQNMKDFQLRNDTKLLFCNDPVHDLADLTRGRNVLFVYGGGSVKKERLLRWC